MNGQNYGSNFVDGQQGISLGDLVLMSGVTVGVGFIASTSPIASYRRVMGALASIPANFFGFAYGLQSN